MRYKTPRLLICRTLAFLLLVSVFLRGHTILFLKQRTKRPQAFEPHIIAYLRYAYVFFAQHLFGSLYAHLCQVFMRRFAVYTCKQPVKMERRKTCSLRHLLQLYRLVVVIVNIHLRAYYTLIYIRIQWHMVKIRDNEMSCYSSSNGLLMLPSKFNKVLYSFRQNCAGLIYPSKVLL